MSPKARDFIIVLFSIALVFWGSAVVLSLLVGLFNPAVDNNRIFAILTPMSQQVSGALISILSGLIAYKVGSTVSKGEGQ